MVNHGILNLALICRACLEGSAHFLLPGAGWRSPITQPCQPPALSQRKLLRWQVRGQPLVEFGLENRAKGRPTTSSPSTGYVGKISGLAVDDSRPKPPPGLLSIISPIPGKLRLAKGQAQKPQQCPAGPQTPANRVQQPRWPKKAPLLRSSGAMLGAHVSGLKRQLRGTCQLILVWRGQLSPSKQARLLGAFSWGGRELGQPSGGVRPLSLFGMAEGSKPRSSPQAWDVPGGLRARFSAAPAWLPDWASWHKKMRDQVFYLTILKSQLCGFHSFARSTYEGRHQP